MEKIKLVTTEEIVYVENNKKEKYIEHLCDRSFEFVSGKTYGLVGEIGSGGEAISAILSGKQISNTQKIYFDDVLASSKEIEANGWYLGKAEYSKLFPHHEISVKKALQNSVDMYHYFDDYNEVIDMFFLKRSLIQYKLSQYSGERLRASLAIGYSSKKNIFCFPWMNSADIFYSMSSGKIYIFFEELKKKGKIVILPTSKEENISGLVDEIIYIDNPHFNHIFNKKKQQEVHVTISLK